jgi:hypothetical protein
VAWEGKANSKDGTQGDLSKGHVKLQGGVALRIVPMQGDARGVSCYEIEKRRLRQN